MLYGRCSTSSTEKPAQTWGVNFDIAFPSLLLKNKITRINHQIVYTNNYCYVVFSKDNYEPSLRWLPMISSTLCYDLHVCTLHTSNCAKMADQNENNHMTRIEFCQMTKAKPGSQDGAITLCNTHYVILLLNLCLWICRILLALNL